MKFISKLVDVHPSAEANKLRELSRRFCGQLDADDLVKIFNLGTPRNWDTLSFEDFDTAMSQKFFVMPFVHDALDRASEDQLLERFIFKQENIQDLIDRKIIHYENPDLENFKQRWEFWTVSCYIRDDHQTPESVKLQ